MTQHSATRQVTHLQNHWRWRPEWTTGRECLWWYLTLAPHPALEGLHRQLAQRLQRSESVDVIPRRWLHLTLHEVGYADRLPRRALDELVGAAVRRVGTLPRFTMRLGAPTVLPGAVVLPATPTGPLTELRRRLHESTRAFAGDRAPGPHPVPPHVSLAYVRQDTLAEAVLRHVDEEAWEPVDVPASRVTLAAVTRRDRHYQWTDRGAVPLGAA